MWKKHISYYLVALEKIERRRGSSISVGNCVVFWQYGNGIGVVVNGDGGKDDCG